MPLRTRIVGALALQPMTCAFLAKCLMRSEHRTRMVLYELRRESLVEVGGRSRTFGMLYRLKWYRYPEKLSTGETLPRRALTAIPAGPVLLWGVAR